MKQIKSQRGAVDIILIAVVLVLAAGLGSYVYYQQQQNNKALDKAGSGVIVTKHSKKPGAAVDPTAGWKMFTSTSGKFSFKYPDSLRPGTCDNTDKIVYLPSTGSVACGTDGQSGMTFLAGDNGPSITINSNDYENIKLTNVTADGVSGTRKSGTIKKDYVGLGAAGEVSIVYTFKVNGTTFLAFYTYTPGEPNRTADFDTMVTKTLKFN